MRKRMSQAACVMWIGLGLCAAGPRLTGQTAPRAQDDDARFQAAMAAQDRGDLEQARTILMELRRRHPGNFAIDESLGMIYAAQQNYAAALPLLEQAAREQPDSDAAQANLGAALYRLHRNAEALTAFRRAAQLNATNAQTEQSLGELLLDAGKPREAVDALGRAVRLKPGDEALTCEYARALLAAKEVDRARTVMESAAEIENSAEGQSVLGEIAEARADYRAAAEHFARAAQLDPSEPRVWELGVEFLRHWTFDAAAREFQAGAEKFPSSTRMELGLATAWFGGAHYGEAIPVIATLLRTHSEERLYAEMLGMACTAVSTAAKDGCSALVDYAMSHPRDARVSTYAAKMLLTEDASPEQAAMGRRLLQQALRSDGRIPEAQYLMGLQKQMDGDWAGSIANLQAALKEKPQLAEAHYRLSLAYWRTGRKEEAQREVALEKKYSQAQREDLDRRLREITTFVVDVRN